MKDVTPLLTHWSYVFLALTHWYGNCDMFQQFFLQCLSVFKAAQLEAEAKANGGAKAKGRGHRALEKSASVSAAILSNREENNGDLQRPRSSRSLNDKKVRVGVGVCWWKRLLVSRSAQ